MSIVTNVILKTGIDESMVGEFQKYLHDSHHLHPQLNQVDNYAGGYKAFECDIWLVALNKQDIEELISNFLSIKWESPEEMQLMIQRQEDDVFEIFMAKKR